MKKTLITGGTGQIGWELRRSLASFGHILTPKHQELDLNDQSALKAYIEKHRPDIIINTAACTAVDVAENDPDMAMRVNGLAPKTLAEEALKLKALLIHFSTDYLFDGQKNAPYQEEDKTNPLNVYGATKLLGEENILKTGCKALILRTSWVYGLRGKNFLTTLLDKAKKSEAIALVSDQIGAPTWSRLIAEATTQMVVQLEAKADQAHSLFGIYHLTCSGQISRKDFAEKIFALKGISQKITPLTSKEFAAPAKRPLYCVLGNDKIYRHFGIKLPSFEEGLKLCLDKEP